VRRALVARRLLLLLFVLGFAACRSAGRFLGELLRERLPAPLEAITTTSDARIDSLGFLVGSFVGEGTSRAVHLLSSDTGFIADVARTYRPDLGEGSVLWRALDRERVITIGGSQTGRRRIGDRGPAVHHAIVGSPLGHSDVAVDVVLLRRGCGPRGAQAEIIVEPGESNRDAPLRGPVLGSFLEPKDEPAVRRPGLVRRDPVAEPGRWLVDELVDRTARAMDSTLEREFPSLDLRVPDDRRIELNTLADVDAADVTAFRASSRTVRYAVSLRERRITAGRDTVVGTAVMVWDSAGAWQQSIFRPTLLGVRRGRLTPYGALRRTVFWRRLQPISDFAFERDNLWMEQVDVSEGSVLWGIVQPRGNVVVAAAEVEGPCR
jgi:hypothetical protein